MEEKAIRLKWVNFPLPFFLKIKLEVCIQSRLHNSKYF